MGWEASVGIRTSAGLRLWDIRFKGERIVYEMALQQAASGKLRAASRLASARGNTATEQPLLSHSEWPRLPLAKV